MSNLSVHQIIKRAGGADAIADRSEGKLSRWAVYKWQAKGIPDPHWPLLIEMAGVKAEDLLSANVRLRRASASPAPQSGAQAS